MILEIVIASILVYVALGIGICMSKSWVRRRKQAAFGAALGSYGSSGPVRRFKMFMFRAAMILGVVFLWPVFWLDDRRTTRK